MNILKLVSHIKMQLYYWQVYLTQVTIYQINHITISTFLLIFFGGVLTSINPCNVSMFPIITSYANHSRLSVRRQCNIILGMLVSFTIIVIIATIFNVYCQQLSKAIPSISFLYMIIIGLSLLGILNFDCVFINVRQEDLITDNFRVKDYLMGFLMVLNSFSCSTPILLSLIYWITKSKFILLGFIYSLSYILGYSIPLLLIIQLTSIYVKLVNNKFWVYTFPFLGSFTLVTGVFLFLNSVFI